MALEFLQVAEAVAREKDIDKEVILCAMEQAIEMGAKRKFGLHWNVKANMDRVSGDVVLKKLIEVVEQVKEPISEEEVRLAQREARDPEMQPALDKKGNPKKQNDIQMLVEVAEKKQKGAKVGDFVVEDMPEMDFGRIAAQAAKQVIFQKVRDAEREKQFEEYENSAGEIISGIVKRSDYHGVLVDLGGAEAFLPKDEMIARETYRQNDRLRAYIYKVQREVRGPQIFLSRTHPEFLKKLFEEEVPEIGSGILEIMGVARDPGFRAKIAVKSYDHNLDPVGACVGIRGVRVQAVTAELQGERIDIIRWNPDAGQFLVAALAPAEVTKVVLDEDENRIEVAVPEDKLSLAIGRRGQNVRLASMLTGWDIDIMSEQEESDKRENESKALISGFITALDVDETLAGLLISEGFRSVNELLMVSVDELGAIEGLDPAIGEELQRRAKTYLNAQAKEHKKLGVEKELEELAGITPEILAAVVSKGIKTLDDFGDLATDELLEMLPVGMVGKPQAESLIMEARKHWFDDEDAPVEVEAETETCPKPEISKGESVSA